MTPSRLLLPLSWLYGAGVALRNLLFDRGLFRNQTVSVPVISVGNISAGGTGKTPFVVELVFLLQKMGKKPAVVSRGYGRRSKGFQVVSNGNQKCAEAITAGDEPALLAEKLQGVPVVVDEKRVRGARKAIELFAPDVIVLDDGFQHRWLSRDCDIVLMTPREILEPSFMLPAGYRREPMSALSRAQVLVISKCRDLDEFRKAAEELQYFRGPVVGLRTTAASVQEFGTGKEFGSEILKNKKAVAFSGIADGASFDRTLIGLGVNVIAHHRFRDHHWYTPNDMTRITDALKTMKADLAVTTEKDIVRMGNDSGSLNGIPLYVVRVRSEIISGKEELQTAIESVLGK